MLTVPRLCNNPMCMGVYGAQNNRKGKFTNCFAGFSQDGELTNESINLFCTRFYKTQILSRVHALLA